MEGARSRSRQPHSPESRSAPNASRRTPAVDSAEVESSEDAGNVGAARIIDRSFGPDVKEPDVFERHEVREWLVREPAVRKGGAMRWLGPATWTGRSPE
jgi:hypothetical protein